MISLDLIVGVITNDTPNITPTELHGPTPLPPYLSDQAFRPVIDSPLYGSQNLLESLELSGLSLRSIRLLENLRTITENVVAGCQPTHDYDLPTDPQHSNLHSGASGSEEIYSSEMDSVVLLTATIYMGALGYHPVPFSSPSNHSTARLLHLAVQRGFHNNNWGCFPGLFTWVLLTGLAASIHLPERTFFVMFLAKTGLCAMQGWWSAFSKSILRFGIVQKRAGI
jgi:hypothetical protein